jgi:hypothetical protein
VRCESRAACRIQPVHSVLHGRSAQTHKQTHKQPNKHAARRAHRDRSGVCRHCPTRPRAGALLLLYSSRTLTYFRTNRDRSCGAPTDRPLVAAGIHPRAKRVIGSRLAAAARALVYGDTATAWTGPVRGNVQRATYSVCRAPCGDRMNGPHDAPRLLKLPLGWDGRELLGSVRTVARSCQRSAWLPAWWWPAQWAQVCPRRAYRPQLCRVPSMTCSVPSTMCCIPSMMCCVPSMMYGAHSTVSLAATRAGPHRVRDRRGPRSAGMQKRNA